GRDRARRADRQARQAELAGVGIEYGGGPRLDRACGADVAARPALLRLIVVAQTMLAAQQQRSVVGRRQRLGWAEEIHRDRAFSTSRSRASSVRAPRTIRASPR